MLLCYDLRHQEENMKFNIVIEKDSNGCYNFCPALKRCQTQGDSLEDVLENIKEATKLYFEALEKQKRHLTQAIRKLNQTLHFSCCVISFHKQSDLININYRAETFCFVFIKNDRGIIQKTFQFLIRYPFVIPKLN